MGTLTTANSALTLQVRDLFPVPMTIEGYSADDQFAFDKVNPGEASMGVDGKLSFGYVPVSKKFRFTLQADSPSMQFMDDVIAAQDAQRTMYIFDGTMILPAINDKFTMIKGGLMEYDPPSAGKTLKPRQFMIEFEVLSKVPA